MTTKSLRRLAFATVCLFSAIGAVSVCNDAPVVVRDGSLPRQSEVKSGQSNLGDEKWGDPILGDEKWGDPILSAEFRL